MQSSWLYVRLLLETAHCWAGISWDAPRSEPGQMHHEPGSIPTAWLGVRSLLPFSAWGRSWLRDSPTLFSMGGSRSYFAEGLNRWDASFLLVNTTSNLTRRLQQMFLLCRVMEILWTIFSSFSCSLGWSSRSKMPWETQQSPPKTHFRAVSPADRETEPNHSLWVGFLWRTRHHVPPGSCTKAPLSTSFHWRSSKSSWRMSCWLESPGVCTKVG